jgi:nitronate monooxygenase
MPKAAEAGVDGLIAVAAGAGGHAGTWSPFALVAEIRQFFDKTLLLAGCLNHGHEILAAQLLGADLAYMGTRFIATESQAQDAYKQMLLGATAADIIHTPRCPASRPASCGKAWSRPATTWRAHQQP